MSLNATEEGRNELSKEANERWQGRKEISTWTYRLVLNVGS